MDRLKRDVRKGQDELAKTQQRLEKVAELSLLTAGEMGEHRAALQIVLFLTGNAKEMAKDILRAYEQEKAEVQAGRLDGCTTPSPSKCWHMHRTTQSSLEAARALQAAQANWSIAAMGGTGRMPEENKPRVMVVTFTPTDLGRNMRALWAAPGLASQGARQRQVSG